MLSPFAVSNYQVGAGYIYIPSTNGSQKPKELAPTVLKKYPSIKVASYPGFKLIFFQWTGQRTYPKPKEFFRKFENIKEPELKVIWFLSFFLKREKAKGSLISKI